MASLVGWFVVIFIIIIAIILIAVGAAYFGREERSNTWRWVLIGIGIGLFVLAFFVIIIMVAWGGNSEAVVVNPQSGAVVTPAVQQQVLTANLGGGTIQITPVPSVV